MQAPECVSLRIRVVVTGWDDIDWHNEYLCGRLGGRAGGKHCRDLLIQAVPMEGGFCSGGHVM